MSGGSFYDLGDRVLHCGEWKDDENNLRNMAACLDKLAPDLGAETRRVLALLTEAQYVAEGLAKVWTDVEWMVSGDIGEEELRASVEKWRADQGPQETFWTWESPKKKTYSHTSAHPGLGRIVLTDEGLSIEVEDFYYDGWIAKPEALRIANAIRKRLMP